MIIPNFEIKDSFILKNKINYNLELDSELTYGMIFTDYDLARKIQPFEEGNFESVIINDNLNSFDDFTIVYYDQIEKIYLDNDVNYESSVTLSTDKITTEYQEYNISTDIISSMEVGDDVEINYYVKKNESGTTTWEHDGFIGETWYISGSTIDNIMWESTGITTTDGESSGTTSWSINGEIPVLKYITKILEVGIDYIRVDRKIESYLYNNLQKNNNNPNPDNLVLNYYDLFYNVQNLQHTDKTYSKLAEKINKSPYGKYYDIILGNNNMTFKPILNDEDIYFDYDNTQLILKNDQNTIVYEFETDHLYNNYTLEKVFNNLNIPSETVMYLDSTLDATSVPYDGSYYLEFNITKPSGVVNFNPLKYFTPYTYITVLTEEGNEYISLLTEISDTKFTIVASRLMPINAVISSISTINTVHDISVMLREVYINIEDDVEVEESYSDPLMLTLSVSSNYIPRDDKSFNYNVIVTSNYAVSNDIQYNLFITNNEGKNVTIYNDWVILAGETESINTVNSNDPIIDSYNITLTLNTSIEYTIINSTENIFIGEVPDDVIEVVTPLIPVNVSASLKTRTLDDTVFTLTLITNRVVTTTTTFKVNIFNIYGNSGTSTENITILEGNNSGTIDIGSVTQPFDVGLASLDAYTATFTLDTVSDLFEINNGSDTVDVNQVLIPVSISIDVTERSEIQTEVMVTFTLDKASKTDVDLTFNIDNRFGKGNNYTLPVTITTGLSTTFGFMTDTDLTSLDAYTTIATLLTVPDGFEIKVSSDRVVVPEIVLPV